MPGGVWQRFAGLHRFASWLSITPLVLVLVPFFVVPMLAVIAASFMESDGFGGIIPHATLENYKDLFTSGLTLNLYLSTLKFTILTWIFTFLIGFGVAYFLAFHVKSPLLSIGLFLVCTIPFWTSNVIRMISWIPLLGQQGLVNMVLTGSGLIHQPLKFLLFSDFAVVVAYVHQLTIFMIVPIYSSLARVDKRVVEAALDSGASRWDVLRLVILPLAKSGIALGSVFVTSIVMGDFFVVKVMSGGNSGSIVAALFENISVLQYPTAAAQAVVLMLVVLLIATIILRAVDVRREIAR
jgi:putative spermidine/putrescine transport system permease protein